MQHREIVMGDSRLSWLTRLLRRYNLGKRRMFILIFCVEALNALGVCSAKEVDKFQLSFDFSHKDSTNRIIWSISETRSFSPCEEFVVRPEKPLLNENIWKFNDKCKKFLIKKMEEPEGTAKRSLYMRSKLIYGEIKQVAMDLEYTIEIRGKTKISRITKMMLPYGEKCSIEAKERFVELSPGAQIDTINVNAVATAFIEKP